MSRQGVGLLVPFTEPTLFLCFLTQCLAFCKMFVYCGNMWEKKPHVKMISTCLHLNKSQSYLEIINCFVKLGFSHVKSQISCEFFVTVCQLNTIHVFIFFCGLFAPPPPSFPSLLCASADPSCGFFCQEDAKY